MVFHLIDIPAAANAENEPPTGQPVQAGDGFRQIERIMLRHQADAGAYFKRLGHGGGEAQAHELVIGMIILLRHLAAAWKRRFAADRDMGVFAGEQRFITALFQLRGKLRKLN